MIVDGTKFGDIALLLPRKLDLRFGWRFAWPEVYAEESVPTALTGRPSRLGCAQEPEQWPRMVKDVWWDSE